MKEYPERHKDKRLERTIIQVGSNYWLLIRIKQNSEYVWFKCTQNSDGSFTGTAPNVTKTSRAVPRDAIFIYGKREDFSVSPQLDDLIETED